MSMYLRRRTFLAGAAAVPAATALPEVANAATTRTPRVVRELEAVLQRGMEVYGIPGLSYGLRYRGHDYVRGFGVTNLDDPVAVDGDTVFRVGSTTKTFTGTAIMRLVERGRIDLDRTVRSYLPDFRTADESASRRVTVRQLLNHSAGWLGDFFLDTGESEQALTRYVEAMSRLPQLFAPGRLMAYNNAAMSLAGHLLARRTGRPYEEAISTLILEPLRLRHSGYFLSEMPPVSVATSHVFTPGGEVVALPAAFHIPRSIGPAGSLISSARDQLAWARYHLGDGRPLLGERSLRHMRSRPGPPGTLFVETDGFGVSWMIRPTAEGPKVIQHGGDWTGQHSGFMFVPERDFALTVLTNSEGGPGLLGELFSGDWALSRLAGLHNLPARSRRLPAAELAPYEGRYVAEQIGLAGEEAQLVLDAVADDGGLLVSFQGTPIMRLVFYRRDYVLVRDPDGADARSRSNFERDRDGSVGWLRYGGRLFRHTDAVTKLKTTGRTFPAPATLPHPWA